MARARHPGRLVGLGERLALDQPALAVAVKHPLTDHLLCQPRSRAARAGAAAAAERVAAAGGGRKCGNGRRGAGPERVARAHVSHMSRGARARVAGAAARAGKPAGRAGRRQHQRGLLRRGRRGDGARDGRVEPPGRGNRGHRGGGARGARGQTGAGRGGPGGGARLERVARAQLGEVARAARIGGAADHWGAADHGRAVAVAAAAGRRGRGVERERADGLREGRHGGRGAAARGGGGAGPQHAAIASGRGEAAGRRGALRQRRLLSEREHGRCGGLRGRKRGQPGRGDGAWRGEGGARAARIGARSVGVSRGGGESARVLLGVELGLALGVVLGLLKVDVEVGLDDEHRVGGLERDDVELEGSVDVRDADGRALVQHSVAAQPALEHGARVRELVKRVRVGLKLHKCALGKVDIEQGDRVALVEAQVDHHPVRDVAVTFFGNELEHAAADLQTRVRVRQTEHHRVRDFELDQRLQGRGRKQDLVTALEVLAVLAADGENAESGAVGPAGSLLASAAAKEAEHSDTKVSVERERVFEDRGSGDSRVAGRRVGSVGRRKVLSVTCEISK